jgi:excisionase family DNA binding protein
MAGEARQLLTAREAAQYMRVSMATLGRMAALGELIPFRTPGGHRRYSLAMLNDYLERSRRPPQRSSREPGIGGAPSSADRPTRADE